jgi:hypothetical protein
MFNAYTIAAAGGQISGAIYEVGRTISSTIREGFETLSEKNYASATLQANSIMSGSSLIFQGLQEIASEIERQAIILEVNSLTSRIREDEEWLSKNKSLKEFYEKTGLGRVMHSHVKPMYLSFLDAICNTTQESNEHLLRNYAMMYRCHPLIYLSAITAERGILIPRYREDPFKFKIWISGTSFGWENYGVLEQDIITEDEARTVDWKQYDKACRCMELQMGPHKITFNEIGLSSGRSASCAKLEEKLTVEYLQRIAAIHEEKHPLSEEATLKWLTFFNKLNAEISLENLRTLSQELSNFVRQKRIELS